MKHLIYFLLFSTVVFSQNYNYAIDEAPKNTVSPLPQIVKNQLEEIEYFNAYLLPISKKATIQSALDEYKSVRLGKGDYSGADIVMKKDYKLYGHPSLTKVSNISIEAGSSGVHLIDLISNAETITFLAGAPITNCVIKSVKHATLTVSNASVANNIFINYSGLINIDCSKSGYFRNNKIIKHQVGTRSNVLVIKGNNTTPSYGNVHLHTNFLTPHGDTSELENLQSATFVGIDAEAWNMGGEGKRAMFYARNIGNLKITDFGGGNGYSAVRTPAYDIDAGNLFIINRSITSSSTDIISPRTNMFTLGGNDPYNRSAIKVTGFDLLGNTSYDKIVKYNGVEQTAKMTNANVITNITNNSILGTEYKPWNRPNWETLPDPLGANWRKERIGKPDSRAYIQNLIDTKGIAELPEGIYYISSTLKLPIDGGSFSPSHGIVGKGTGKTVIVGLTDNFPLISLLSGSNAHFALAYLTLQGGSVGVYSSQDFGWHHLTYQNMKFVVFRDQTYGIQLKQTVGFDNNFLENLGFVNCNIGFFQDPLNPYGNIDTSSFVDKTMFYKNQFINCKTSVSMLATRADNLDAWVDCKFDGGQTAFSLKAVNFPIVANCDFTNFTGKNIASGSISFYNSNFYNNRITGSLLSGISLYMEGCNFLDNVPMFDPIKSNTPNIFVVNSTVTGDATVTPPTSSYGEASIVFVNSTLLSNPTLSKLLVNVKNGVPTIILNTTPKPYPQLLVTQ